MGNVISNLFGGKPKKPNLVTQPTPIEKVQQSNIEKEKIMKEMAKRRKATLLQQGLGQLNIKQESLGAKT
jgi:hypothetical protein